MSTSIERMARCQWRMARAGTLLIALLCAACAENQKDSAKFGEWHGADRQMVISGNPARDSAALNNADEKLEEADWQVLQQLGPKPIWERLDFMSKQARARSAKPTTAQSTTTAT